MEKLNQDLRKIANKTGKHVAALKTKKGAIINVFISARPLQGVLPFTDAMKYPDHQLLAWAFPVKPGFNKINPGTGKIYNSDEDWKKDYIQNLPDTSKIRERLMKEFKPEFKNKDKKQ